MTPQEFKAWFDGFTEALDGVPSKPQWARIKARVAEIDGKAVTERVYVDRYYPQYIPPAYPYYQRFGQVSINVGASGCSSSSGLMFNATQAMADLGRLEAKGIS